MPTTFSGNVVPRDEFLRKSNVDDDVDKGNSCYLSFLNCCSCGWPFIAKYYRGDED
jgi:hypothetical protein